MDEPQEADGEVARHRDAASRANHVRRCKNGARNRLPPRPAQGRRNHPRRLHHRRHLGAGRRRPARNSDQSRNARHATRQGVSRRLRSLVQCERCEPAPFVVQLPIDGCFMSWKRNNLLRWVAELRRHPVTGPAACVAGMFLAVITSILDHPGLHQPSALGRILSFVDDHPAAFSLVGIAFFFWFLGAVRFPRQRGAIFVICIFAGTIVGRFVYSVATQLASSSFW